MRARGNDIHTLMNHKSTVMFTNTQIPDSLVKPKEEKGLKIMDDPILRLAKCKSVSSVKISWLASLAKIEQPAFFAQ